MLQQKGRLVDFIVPLDSRQVSDDFPELPTYTDRTEQDAIDQIGQDICLKDTGYRAQVLRKLKDELLGDMEHLKHPASALTKTLYDILTKLHTAFKVFDKVSKVDCPSLTG